MTARGWTLTVLIATAALIEVFHAFPRVDLAVGGWLYQEEHGFLLQDTLFNWFYTAYLRPAITVSVALFFIAGCLSWIRGKPVILTGRAYLFVILCIALNTALVANLLLKEHSGRARPVQVTQFGGDKTYTPPFTLAFQCRRNCSTVAGDAALAFNALALALLAARRRKLWISLGLGFGILGGATRVLQGKHFFSDAVLAGMLSVLVILILYQSLGLDREDGMGKSRA